MFEFWDWVGGRYSVWSAIGLYPGCALYRHGQFRAVTGRGLCHGPCALPGSRTAGRSSRYLALTGILYSNFFGCDTHAILPYDQYLRGLHDLYSAARMSSLSNGKSVTRDGGLLHAPRARSWGEPGPPTASMLFISCLMSGARIVPCDFLAPAVSHNTWRAPCHAAVEFFRTDRGAHERQDR